MPTSQSTVSSTTTALAGSATFTSLPENTLNYTGADICLYSDQPCIIRIYGGILNGPWTEVFNSGVTTANTGYSATYLTFYPYSYLTVTNQSATPQTILQVAHIFRVHSHIMETTSTSSVVADVNVLTMPPITGTVGITGPVALATGTVVGITGTVDVSIGDVVLTDLRTVSGGAITLGQKNKDASFPVTIATDQVVNVAVSGGVETNISTVGGEIITLGPKLATACLPVVLATDQPLDVTITGGTSDSNIVTVSGTAITLGAKASAGSFPVVLPTDQTVNVSVSTAVEISGTVDTNISTVGGNASSAANPLFVELTDGGTPVGTGINPLVVSAVQQDAWSVGILGTADTNLATIGGNALSVINPLFVELSDGANTFGTSANPLNTADKNLAPCIVGDTIRVLPYVTESVTTVWSAGVTPINYGLGKDYPFEALIVGSLGKKRVSIYGSIISLDPTVSPLTLTIVYSQTGTPNSWYNSSNGVLSFSGAGDFSRDFETSAPYVSAYINSLATAVLIASVL